VEHETRAAHPALPLRLSQHRDGSGTEECHLRHVDDELADATLRRM
jgi:hypothetical protein